jgi:lipopolysaccharide export system permease protein
MIYSATFSKYIIKAFFKWFITVTLALGTISSIFNIVEILRRAQNKPNVLFKHVVSLSLYQLPELLDKLMPFIFLFSAMLVLWQLSRRSELVVARAMGFSIWNMILSLSGAAIIYSFLYFLIINPIGAELTAKYDKLDSVLFSKGKNLFSLSNSGVWLKQSKGDTYSIVHVKKIGQSSNELHDVTIYTYNNENDFINRIDSGFVKTVFNGWKLKNAVLSEETRLTEPVGDLFWETDLTISNIQENFDNPLSISIWNLPSYINLLEKAGLSGIEHLLYFYDLISLPLKLIIMIALAGVCAYNFSRQKAGGLKFILTGLFSGYAYFLVTNFSHALGLSRTIPILVGITIPLFLGIVTSLSLLIQLEEN